MKKGGPKNFMHFVFLLLTIALSCLLIGVSPKGGRGGGGRGSSGGRGRGSSGSRGSSGRSSSYSSSRGSSGRSYSGRIGNGRSSTIVSSLAGGYVGYKLGKISSRITHGHYSTSSYGRTYYYGSRYYNQPTSNQYDTCIYEIEPNDQYFDLTYNDTGSRVTEVIYQCRAANETCCDGLDCCPRSWSVSSL
uniref:CX domain-containing protein n=1 Tax=Romanomermis culicivorax TaxID=13658 RepID=A0A915J4W2_ROMCU